MRTRWTGVSSGEERREEVVAAGQREDADDAVSRIIIKFKYAAPW